MSYQRFIRSILMVLALAFSQPGFAAQTIDWEVLVPIVDVDNTFTQLDDDLKNSVYDLLKVTQIRTKRGRSHIYLDELEDKALAALEAEGVDAEMAFRGLLEVEAQAEVNENKFVTELDGKTIKMPGYVLPTAFSGTQVVEFLLVPYVGACVHTPPPPANQVVLVKVDEGFESDGLFMPVWVTGKINTAKSELSVAYDDGSTNVEAGYSISASEVVAFE